MSLTFNIKSKNKHHLNTCFGRGIFLTPTKIMSLTFNFLVLLAGQLLQKVSSYPLPSGHVMQTDGDLAWTRR